LEFIALFPGLSFRAARGISSLTMQARHYSVYILANKHHTVLYVGVTNDLKRRMWEHKTKAAPGFTSRYNIDQLMYFETSHDIVAAIAREKQLKGYGRNKKTVLIERENPAWADLSAGWL
jgi:putative endonuclease